MKKHRLFLIVICLLFFASNSSAKAVPTADEIYQMMRSDDVRAFQEALADGLNPNETPNPSGLTLLHTAILSNSFGITQELLEAGADIDAGGSAGTPLLSALLTMSTKTVNKPIRENQMKIITMLLDRGASTKALNEFGDSPLNLAASVKDLEYALEISRRLIERGADVNWRNDLSLTPMHEVFTVFVTTEAVPDQPMPEIESRAPLVALLIASGADVNVRSIDGETPLFYALGDLESMKLLLDAGAKIDTLNNKGEMPLDVAFKENPSAVKLLLMQIGN